MCNLYLSSSSFSLLSFSSFSLCSLASRLFSASSLVASSGSVVPAEALGTTAAAAVDGGVEIGAGSRAGAGVGLGTGAETGAAVQTGTRRTPNRTKQNWPSPCPRPGIHHSQRKGNIHRCVCSHGFPAFCLSVTRQPVAKTAYVSETFNRDHTLSPSLIFIVVKSVNNIYKCVLGALC